MNAWKQTARTLLRCRTPNGSFVAGFNASSCFYSHSPKLFAKAPNAKGGKGKVDEEEQEIVLPDMDDASRDMERKIDRLEVEFSKIRGGRASADMLNFIRVEAYGDRIPITDAAQISLKTPTKLVVQAYDAGIVPFVANAIRDADLGITPIVEGSVILVNVPKPSKEARDALYKLVAKQGEQCKAEMRHVRKSYMDKIKNLKGKISEDDMRRLQKEVDVLTEKKTERVTKLIKDKEASVMES